MPGPSGPDSESGPASDSALPPKRQVRMQQNLRTSISDSPPFVLPLLEASGASAADIGGKARGLNRLAELDVRVPDGFVVTSAALLRVLEANDLTPPGPEAGEEELRAFQDCLRRAPFPSGVLGALVAAYRARIGDQRAVAIRSSATREDLDDASFAGMYETFLNVTGAEAVADGVRACWASLWAPRVQEYARRRDGAGKPAMSVIVQEMVRADVAGVTFTVNPLTGREEEMLVESAFGLGEAVVSGRMDADRFVVEARSGRLVKETIATKERKIVAATGGTTEVALPVEEVRSPSLSAEQLEDLAAAGREIQAHLGYPTDIEWAYEAGRLFVLQARPITHVSFSPELGEWTTADFRDGGVSSDVCTPFMWSLYDDTLSISMPEYFKRLRLIRRDHDATWGRMFFGRPYWNLGEVKKALERIPGYDEASFHADMGVEVDSGFEATKTPTTVLGVLRALPTLLALKRLYRDQLETDRDLLEGFEGRVRPYDLEPESVAALDDETFRRRYRELVSGLYLDTETSYFTTIYNTSNAKLDLSAVLEKVQAALGREVDVPTLLSGLRDLSHLHPMKDLHRIVSELRRENAELDPGTVRSFAWRWRHRGRKELDIRVPRWSEELDHVRSMIETALAAHDPGDDPRAHEEARHQAYLTALRELLDDLRWRPILRWSLKRKLRLMRRYAWWREEMRDRSSFVYYLVRVWTLEAARRLEEAGRLREPDDVWFLGWRRVVALLEGRLDRGDAAAEIAWGRHVYRSFRHFDNPGEIGTHFRSDRSDPGRDDGLRGTACSSGEVAGRARVLNDLAEAKRIRKGEILVTRFTDPGWTPLFSRIGGVVTETGGVLSHAAVISREYGIPAVLGVAGATEIIGDGDRIRVDGGRGLVEILERVSPASALATPEEPPAPQRQESEGGA